MAKYKGYTNVHNMGLRGPPLRVFRLLGLRGFSRQQKAVRRLPIVQYIPPNDGNNQLKKKKKRKKGEKKKKKKKKTRTAYMYVTALALTANPPDN